MTWRICASLLLCFSSRVLLFPLDLIWFSSEMKMTAGYFCVVISTPANWAGTVLDLIMRHCNWFDKGAHAWDPFCYENCAWGCFELYNRLCVMRLWLSCYLFGHFLKNVTLRDANLQELFHPLNKTIHLHWVICCNQVAKCSLKQFVKYLNP